MTQTGLARDKSIVSLSAGDNLAIDLNGNRQFLHIENTGNANATVNYSGPAAGGTGPNGKGNTAAAGSTGAFTILPGGSIFWDRWAPQNPIVVAGTTGQSVAISEG